MPIYVYTCEKCKKTVDIAQPLSEPHLTACPVCKSPRFRRVITAPMLTATSKPSRRIACGSVGEFGPEL
jgi:putative FmdB family regulatory protein